MRVYVVIGTGNESYGVKFILVGACADADAAKALGDAWVFRMDRTEEEDRYSFSYEVYERDTVADTAPEEIGGYSE